jgi:hypothetical protein
MTTKTPTPTPAAVQIGLKLARRIFASRGNHSEVHLREMHLAAMLAVAAEQGRQS